MSYTLFIHDHNIAFVRDPKPSQWLLRLWAARKCWVLYKLVKTSLLLNFLSTFYSVVKLKRKTLKVICFVLFRRTKSCIALDGKQLLQQFCSQNVKAYHYLSLVFVSAARAYSLWPCAFNVTFIAEMKQSVATASAANFLVYSRVLFIANFVGCAAPIRVRAELFDANSIVSPKRKLILVWIVHRALKHWKLDATTSSKVAD